MTKYDKFTEPILLVPFTYYGEDYYVSIGKDRCGVHHWDRQWNEWSNELFAFVPNEDPIGQAKEEIFDYLIENELLKNED